MIKPTTDLDETDKLLSLKDLAAKTGINIKTLTDLCTSKQLQHVQIGTGQFRGKRWVRPSWWREYEERQIRAAMGPANDTTAAKLALEFSQRSAEIHQRGRRKAAKQPRS